jgi:hypothetical protein
VEASRAILAPPGRSSRFSAVQEAEDWLNAEAAARYLALTVGLIYRLIEDGTLNARRRFPVRSEEPLLGSPSATAILLRVPDPSLSRSQIRTLGSRLRKTERPSEEDLRVLQRFRAAHSETLDHVAAVLVDLGLEPTTRLKTVETIVQKLHRANTDLSRMQDVAGARVVRNCTLEEQDELVSVVVARFNESDVVDRRYDPNQSTLRVDNLRAPGPSYGYRAVHVVLIVDRLLVEVQLRTGLQDLWAQVVERVSDQWGRAIRYGEGPEDRDLEITGGWTRGGFVEMLGQLSQQIAIVEAWPGKFGAEQRELSQLRRALESQARKGGKRYAAAVHHKRQIRRSEDEMAQLRASAEEATHQLAETLAAITKVEL